MNTIVKGIRARKRNRLVEFDVDLQIDVRKLAQLLGERAVQNKSRSTMLASGLIKVRVRGTPEPVAASGSQGPLLLEEMLNGAFGRKI